MCTSVSCSDQALFGRSLDLESPFGEQVVIAPREYPFRFHHRLPLVRHHALIGMAALADGVPLYAEAVNEKGLYMAGLNFPASACYFPDDDNGRHSVAPYELIPLVLGSCGCLAEARRLLEGLRLTAIPFAPGWPLAPLHWHLADASGALVAEPTGQGLRLYDDPVGVLTNEPPFDYQQTRLRDFMALSPRQPANTFAPGLPLAPYAQGMGALGLPGDASSASRYVRAAFLKTHAAFPGQRQRDVMQFFHILDGVSMVRGTVVTPAGKLDETRYVCCADGRTGTYYYKTYDGGRVRAVALTEAARQGAALRAFPLVWEPEIDPVAEPSA
ncbi:MAG TPA: choloylglycine hydrolase family protein [Candidatus Fournierella merdigallinarum]|nr:choloylglycine hydrolase family protein [Candidatus Fournierella merdigallinarum]